jgi:hypothetical protein
MLRESDPMAWLLASEDIRQLASRYAIHYGARDLDRLVELFVPDIRVSKETSGRVVFDQQFAGLGRTILQVNNHLIDVADHDNATGIVSCRGEIEDVNGKWIIHQIQYHDTYRRVDGRWGFVKRRHLLWYGHDMPNPPVGLPDANWPSSQTGKGELPECLESWQEWSKER